MPRRATDRIRRILAPILVAAGASAGAGAAWAETGRTIAGPVAARLVRVVDGDTIVVRARIWPDHYVETLVRLAGIDAPELKGRCAAEIAQAQRARARLVALLRDGAVVLRAVRYGKYAGRVVARVETEAGRDVARVLLDEGLARAGGRRGRRRSWCGAPAGDGRGE